MPLCLVALITLGAAAWLTNVEPATKVNKITPGTFDVHFANDETEIVVENAIPMTTEYAKENLTWYEFDVVNNSSVAVNYKIVYDESSISTFGTHENEFGYTINDLHVIVSEDDTSYSGGQVVLNDKTNYLDYVTNLAPGEIKHYKVIFYISEGATDVEGKSATIRLKLEATQYVEPGEPWSVQIMYNEEALHITSVEDNKIWTADEDTYKNYPAFRTSLQVPPISYIKTNNPDVELPESYDLKFYKVEGDTKTDITDEVDYDKYLTITGNIFMKDGSDFSGSYIMEIIAK